MEEFRHALTFQAGGITETYVASSMNNKNVGIPNFRVSRRG